MGMIYVIGNYIDAGTLSSVSTEDTPNYGKENMYNLAQSVPWRMTAKPGHAIFDFGAGTDRPTILGIMNHNLLGTGAYSITLKTAANEAGLIGAPAEDIAWHVHNIYHVITTTPNQWWRLDVSDPDNGSNLEFGEVVLYAYSEFSMPFWWPYKEGMDYIVDENITHYGRRHRVKRAKKKKFVLDYDGVTDTNFVSEIEAFFDALDGDQPFIFVPESTGTNSWYMECLNSLEAQRIFIDRNKFSLNLEEQSRGIILL